MNEEIIISPVGKLAGALAKAQLKIEGAKKDSSNPYFKSSYADLSSVWDACHTALNENGIAIIQLLENGLDHVSVRTMLVHETGESIQSVVSVRPKVLDAQGLGSAVTYLRRYALAAITGVCPIDDDAEAAQGRKVEAKAAPAQVKNDKKTRIVTLCKQAGIQPTEQTQEAWERTIKASFDLTLTEENYDKIITALEKTLGLGAMGDMGTYAGNPK